MFFYELPEIKSSFNAELIGSRKLNFIVFIKKTKKEKKICFMFLSFACCFYLIVVVICCSLLVYCILPFYVQI